MRSHGINGEFIERVKQANNIVGVAGKYLRCTQKGRTHWACCPFHHEKTASFAINEMNQYYHCFGCGVSGDVISLVQQLESLDFYDALELLAKNSGIEMPKAAMNENFAVQAKKKHRVLDVLAEACAHYCENLYLEKNKSYLEYLHNRGVTDELIKLFHIGASSDWNETVVFLKKKGFTEAEIVESGIAVKNESGNVYDAMAMRVTFAIFNIYGDCIGFTGRTMQTGAEIAKYKNTAQTIVFDKSNIVYGVDVLKANKRASYIDKLIVTEGNVDVVSLVGAGFLNTVACMGTALTPYHAKIFKRFTDQVYICFDGDSAGQKAALRGLDILSAENLSVRVISLPDNMDPDDFIKKRGKSEFEKLIAEARPLIDYKLDVLEQTGSLKDNLGKTAYLKNAAEVLKPLAGTPQLELYVPRVAGAAGVSFDSVMRSVGETKTAGAAVGSKTSFEAVGAEIPVTGSAATAYTRAVQFVVAAVTHGLKEEFDGVLEDRLIENNLYVRLLEKIAEHIKKGKKWRLDYIFDMFENDEIASLEPIINFKEAGRTLDEMGKMDIDKNYEGSINYLLKSSVAREKEKLLEEYKNTDVTEEKAAIAQRINELNKRIKR